MYVAKAVFDFLFFGQLTVLKIRMRNLCEHMYVAKVVCDFLFCGQVTVQQNMNAEPL